MKRELAALETATAVAAASPVAGSIGRKTRFGNSNGVSQRLVYKRVKRSPSTVAAAAATAAVVIGEEKKEDLASKLTVSNGGVAVEVDVSRSEEKVGSLNEKEENSLGEGEKESKGVGAVDDESIGVKSNGEVSAMEVEEKENEKAENGEEKAEEMVMERGVVAVEDDAVMHCVDKEAVMEEAAVAVEEEVVAEKCTNENLVDGNAFGAEVEMEKLVEEALPGSPVKVVASGRGKKFGVEQYQRRFTRSALKCNVVEDKAAEVTAKAKEVKVEGTVGEVKAEVCREDTAVLENNVDECARRATRSSVGKPKEDGPDSCLTETSDSVVADKENAETGISNNEDGECDMDKLVVEDTETMSGSPSDKLEEVTTSKQIVVSRTPTTVRELFETGLLEGCPVYYDGGKGPAALRGRIRAIGICCPCKLCRGRKVIAPSVFEIHATNVYKRAVQYIYLENGRSFIQILKACKTRMKTVAEAVRNAIGPLPERKPVVCLNCQEPYLTMDPECSDPVCCACIMSNMSPVGPVYSSRRVCSSSKYGTSQAVSSYGKLQDCNLENPASKKSKGKSAKKKAGRLPSSKMRSSPRTGRTSEPKTSEKAAKNSEEVFQEPKACSSPMTGKSLASKTPKKRLKKPFKAALSPVPSKLTRVGKSPKIDGRVKATKRDIRLHKLVFEDDILPDGTELGYYARGKKLLDGFKQGAGIFCNCCETVISASQFEAHAGCAARRKPEYCYIYTSNGVSLHELSINLIKGRRHSAKFNDDLCSICADGGDLLLCDGCPRAFHTECASLSSIPRGKWYCKYCENMFEREKFVAHNANAFAAGRVSGVDPMEQITKRSIRIVNNVGSDVSSCILCRGFDFCKSGFGPRTIILCDQCEKEYHVGCLKDHDMADLTELPEGKWFCSLGCGRIESALENLLIQGVEKLPESLLNIIRRKNLQSVSEGAADADVSWRLLSGKIASPETRPLLSQAVAIFHESFAPIVEVVSGHDLIPAMVYGRNVGGQEYGGMYCAVLTVNSVVVSAAIFRVFGPEVAELPLVATSSGNHGKGYFQALFACIERLLATLKIKTFVLPAAEEAESIWTDRFGFKKMTPDQLRQLKSNFWSMVRFQGTSMLHKPVPECTVVESPGE